MSVIAGTLIFTRDDTSYFMVTDEVPTPEFFTVKMHRHAGDTALGSMLSGIKSELGINPDNLRLGELAAWRRQTTDGEDMVSLYTFDVVDPTLLDLDRLQLMGMQFASAKDVADLLQHVDMTGIARLD